MSTASASEILHDNPISRMNVGSGISNVARIATRPAANMMLLLFASFDVSETVGLFVLASAIILP